MKLFFFALALLFVTVSGAKAQDQATVVASCGTAHYTAGQQAFRTVNVNGVTCSGAASLGTATLFLYTGESNAGGRAPNTVPPLASSDLLPKPNIQILNNTTLAFEPLQIGVNNLIGHSGLTPDNSMHGSELGWAIAADAGRLTGLPVFLVKAGQGGSQIANWIVPGSAFNFWPLLVTRYNAAVAAIHALGYSNINVVVMYSQGLNDIANSVPAATWQASTQTYFNTQLHPLVGANAPIIMSHFNSTFPNYDPTMDAIAAADPHVFTMAGDGTLWQGDNIHRTSPGYANWAEVWLDRWLLPNGTSASPSISPASGTFPTSVTVTISAATGEKIYYSTDGSDPLTNQQLYSGPLTLTSPVAVKARAFTSGQASSPIVSASYTASASTWSSVDAAGSMTLTNGGLTVTPTGHTWTSVRTTTNHSSGLYYVEFKNTAPVTINTEMIGLAGDGFNPGNYLGATSSSFGAFPGGIFTSSGFTGFSSTNPTNPASGDVWALAVNFTTGKAWLAQNNVWLTGIGGSAGNPAVGTFPYVTFASGISPPGPLFPAMAFDDPAGGVWTLQSTSASQTYAPPSGFSSWN